MARPKDKQELIANLKTIYDSFSVKNLTWDEFRRQMLELYDPNKMFNDLSDIELKRAREKMNRMRINKAIK